MTVVINDTAIAAAGRAAVRIRSFYNIEALLEKMSHASVRLSDALLAIPDAACELAVADGQVEAIELRLLAEVEGKSELQRQANLAQARKDNSDLKIARSLALAAKTNLLRLEAERDARSAELSALQHRAMLVASELNALGDAAAKAQEV